MAEHTDELAVYARQGYGNNSGFGEKPAIIVVDFINSFADPEQFGGGNTGDAIVATAKLLAAARKFEVPIAYTRVVYAGDGSDTGVFCLKAPNLARLVEDAPGSQIVASLAPQEGDAVFRKTQPSAFFGTDLIGWLVHRRIDTVVVAGATTSGCVRATVVDSMSNNFKTVVVTDCVGDRAIGPHEANLFDMRQKYADLMIADEVIARFAS